MTVYSMQVAFHYEFDRPSGAGRQLFRILPAEIPGRQNLLHAEIRIEPDPAETAEFTDFHGMRVIEMIMPPGLTQLEFVLEAEVERIAHDIGLDISTPLGVLPAEIAAYRSIDPHAPHHFLAPTPRIPAMPKVAEYAARVTRKAVTTRESVEALGRALHRDMAFQAGATDVNTPPAQAFAQRRGVCQDFAQIMVGGLRSLGIPAAYVGGYLRTLPPPGQPRLVGADATHAWVRGWCGTETGWVDYDPTNGCFALGDHIEIGFGRDYDDVAPVTGMLRLDGQQTGSHSVDIEEAPLTPHAGGVWTPALDLPSRPRRIEPPEDDPLHDASQRI
ncbi:transglutaminase-like domain-containing protein [Paracoccus laeviglucosivorans]|uniref:Transglutaminase-like enzyme, putative cysteine protease n=1 Tax=Paracoccus laeviglucosivorans TaxID=1197861 RepID=A0A521CB81_9RHOB|nr:transglutaminase family protein [Paracoccus laeviglucosivorans]SMO56707.1 Transglutaminase-like enzyme, putative cysteine protease [Paracoccus laeviglucosivorans]